MSATSQFLSYKEVIQLIGLSKSTIWRLYSRNLFPKPMLISHRRIAFKASEIEEWIKLREHIE